MSQSLEQSLEQFNQHQQATLQIHEQYLNHQKEYTKIFFELMQQQNQLLSSNNYAEASEESKSAILENLERNMMRFHDHQSQTLRVHEQSLQHQVEYLNNFCQLTRKQYELLLQDKLPLHHLEEVIKDSIAATRTQTIPVFEKISSNGNGSKSVQKNGVTKNGQTLKPLTKAAKISSNGHSNRAAVETPKPKPITPTPQQISSNGHSNNTVVETPKLQPVTPTPQQVSSNCHSNNTVVKTPKLQPVTPTPQKVSSNGHSNNAVVETLKPQPVTPTPQQVSSNAQSDLAIVAAPVNAIDCAKLSQILLDVVSEKTGYPPEMLEMDMDMEADLGIDSIKRIEILGALQEMFPDVPPPNPEELGELRTLGQIVEAMQTLMGGISQTTPETVNQLTEVTSTQASEEVEQVALTETEDLNTPDRILLKVVSEKTGYPLEMLEMDMDMEADLGIDKIKGFEILKAMQEEFPNSSNIDVFKVARMRTLGQIIKYINEIGKKKVRSQT